jgi:hypothetical protein
MMAQTAAEAAMIARWAVADAALVARKADRRSAYLKALIASLQRPITEHGQAGFAQVINNATSARGARLVRAKRLYIGRQHQLNGPRLLVRSAVRVALCDAMVWRIAEKSRAETESMRAEFDRIEEMAS